MISTSRPNLFNGYLATVILSGGFLLALALQNLPTYEPLSLLALLAVLSVVTAFTTTYVSVGEAGMLYTIGPAIGLAAVPLFGTGSSCLLVAIYHLTVWVIKPRDKITWQKSWSQLAFNISMDCIAVSIAGTVLLLLRTVLGANTIAGWVLPWLPVAFVLEAVNFWLLMGVMRLQHGSTLDPVGIWQTDFWATKIGVLVAGAGAGFLAYAVDNYGWLGGLVFAFPFLLSSYAFRLYTEQMKEHMNNLEKIVAERTNELKAANEQKDHFLAVLTHDMMTPLASIRTCAELIRSNPGAESNNQKFSQYILRSEGLLFHMVRNILDIEKLRAGTPFILNKQPCNLTQIVGQIAKATQFQANDAQITLHMDLQPNISEVMADPMQIERIVSNLLSNSLKYSEAGGEIFVRLALTIICALPDIKIKRLELVLVWP